MREYFGRVAVDYPPLLVLNVEPVADSHRFLELMVNTAGGNFSYHLWNPAVQALRSGNKCCYECQVQGEVLPRRIG